MALQCNEVRSSSTYGLLPSRLELAGYDLRIDRQTRKADKLQAVKAVLAAGAPMEFGFDVFSNYGTASKTGIFDIPGAGDTIVGGHAVLAVGYDDLKGALVIKNSWGATGRPDKRGYYYLPYWYLNNNHAADFWTLTGARFLNARTVQFLNEVFEMGDAVLGL